MAGGHALSRVDSGVMKFRPGVASVRRPNIPPTPTRLTAASTALTPSLTRTINSNNMDSSDTEAGPSTRNTIPIVTSRTANSSRVNITPGMSRTPNRPDNASILPGHDKSLSDPGRAIIPASTIGISNAASVQGPSLPSGTIGPSHPSDTEVAIGIGEPMEPIGYLNHALLAISDDFGFPAPLATHGGPPLTEPGNVTPTPIQRAMPHMNNPLASQSAPVTHTHIADFPVDPDLLELVHHLPNDQLVDKRSNTALQGTQSIELIPTVPVSGDMPPPPTISTFVNEQTLDTDVSETDDPSSSKRARKPNPRGERAESNEENAEPGETKRPRTHSRRKRSEQSKRRKAATIQERIEALEQEAARAAEAADNEPLDPTTATMASLCESDLPTGRLSSKYLEKGIAYVKHVEERRQRIMERTAERLRQLRSSGLDPSETPPPKKPESTLVEANPDANADANANTNVNASPISGPSSSRRELGASLSPSPEREPPPQETFTESAAAPQIRFVNGEMVLDEESQFYDRAGPEVQDEDSMVVVDEADSTRFSNSSSFMKKAGARGSRWTADETEMFYWCLSAFGEDYENIARYLGRTPLQCKNKTKAEDRRGNEKRITMAIKTRIPLDLEEFGRITGRDFSGPPPTIRTLNVAPRTDTQERESVVVTNRTKAPSTTPATTPRKNRKIVSHGEEEVMTREEYERDGKED